ncbi:MAG: hypothetical protein ACYCO0_04915 [Candidatus Micrarchaeaceae archaeon]
MSRFFTRVKGAVNDIPTHSHSNWTVIIGIIYAGATVAASNLGYTNIKNKDEALAIVGATVITGLFHVGQRVSAHQKALKSNLRNDDEKDCTVVKITSPKDSVNVNISIKPARRK